MKKAMFGILFGAVAGLIDVIPMIAQKLTWDANFSAFSMWVVSGFLISTFDPKLHFAVKGILVPFCVMLPCAILVGSKEPMSLIPMLTMTVILGLLLGFALEKVNRHNTVAEAIDAGFGAWKKKDHPELKAGSAAYVRKMRKGRKTAKVGKSLK